MISANRWFQGKKCYRCLKKWETPFVGYISNFKKHMPYCSKKCYEEELAMFKEIDEELEKEKKAETPWHRFWQWCKLVYYN